MSTGTGLRHPDIDEVDLSTVLLAPADPHRRQGVREPARVPKTDAPVRDVRKPYRPSVSARSIASSAQRATMARPAARAS